MRYLVFATDYDGTLAEDGKVDPLTLEALDACRASGRRLVLVTGRQLDDLARVFERFDLFEWIVAENGALIHHPAKRETRTLGALPTQPFLEALRARNVPFAVGECIVATWQPHEETVLEVIRTQGLELQVIFNKGAVMVLPSGVNKATGLGAVLEAMGVSAHNVVAVGDAENDHAFLQFSEAAAAVFNAIAALKDKADVVTQAAFGAGVRELIAQVLRDDLAGLEGRLVRHHILVGHREDGSEYRLPPYGPNVLIAGTSGGGKSSFATALLERLDASGYQFCVIDPEGDYESFEEAVALGTAKQPPQVDAMERLLADSRQNGVLNMIGVPLEDRPPQFARVLGRLQEARERVARPHWILVDEAHHVLPAAREANVFTLPDQLHSTIFVTLEPDGLVASALAKMDILVAAGGNPVETARTFAAAVDVDPPRMEPLDLASGEYLVWEWRTGRPPFRVRLEPGKSARRRHGRKYAEGEIEPDRSFYFRGPEGKLSLRAQNLTLFLQLADGVDDETWMHHLRQGDYSQWFRHVIKDNRLADRAATVEADTAVDGKESRRRIRVAIEEHYTLPATKGPASAA